MDKITDAAWSGGIYEGDAPYIFISYSHRDSYALERVKAILEQQKVRYWYDDGLHSGDDWNTVIATRLKSSTLCLLLLSPNSVGSPYVKNELVFANNHRIPIHTLRLLPFNLPLDFELMISQIQMIEMEGDYGKELLRGFPPEVFADSLSDQKSDRDQHPLFEIGQELFDRQGTKTFQGRHHLLNYKCIIQADSLRAADQYEAEKLGPIAAGLSHPFFPQIYDIVIREDQMWSYQEYGDVEFLDHYLKSHPLSEEQILEWILSAVEALDYLLSYRLGLRDLARGSLMVQEGRALRLYRLQNLYYGLIRLQPENMSYYFERELQELAILLAQLCLSEAPSLPLRIIKEPRFGKGFLEKVNLVIQKCAKENGKAVYSDFKQLKADLLAKKLTKSDKVFLAKRAKKLAEYDAKKAERRELFTAGAFASPAAPILQQTLEEEFGFEGTVTLQSSPDDSPFEAPKAPLIRLRLCSTGQTLEFSKKEILIGRDAQVCDLTWTQPYVSRMHTRLRLLDEGRYLVADLGGSNRTTVAPSATAPAAPVGPDGAMEVGAGAIVGVGEAKFEIL